MTTTTTTGDAASDSYREFIESKRIAFEACGITIDKNDLNPMLFDFQKDIVTTVLSSFIAFNKIVLLIGIPWAK